VKSEYTQKQASTAKVKKARRGDKSKEEQRAKKLLRALLSASLERAKPKFQHMKSV
jgi:hypothetical protein